MDPMGVIFDMDGVLVDSYQAHFESWCGLAARHGVEMAEQQFMHGFGKTSREIISELWGDVASQADIPAWDAEKEALYRRQLRTHFPEMDGASELIRALHEAGFAMAIGSSGPPENVAVVAECLPSGGLIAATVNGHDVDRGKPAPDVFLRAAEMLNLPPRRCLVVEDAPVGVTAARRANMAVVAITGTVDRAKLAEADRVVDSLREVTPAIVAELIEKNRE